MLTVVLTILKVIGIVLLCLLGVALLLVLLVLFVPVRYEVSADIREPSSADEALTERIGAKGGFSWLMRFVRGVFVYPIAEDGAFRIFVAFLRVFPRKEKPARAGHSAGKKRRGRRRDSTDDGMAQGGATDSLGVALRREDGWARDEVSDDTASEAASDAEYTDSVASETASQAGTTEATGDADAGEATGQDAAETTAGGTAAGRRGRGKPSLAEHLGRLHRNLDNLSKKPQIASKKLYYTICGAYDKLKMTRATIESDCFSRAAGRLIRETGRVLKHLLPRRCRIELVYGADDPKKTADLLAKLWMLYPFLEERVVVTPVFDEKTLYGTVRIRGRVMVVVLLFAFLRCFLSRDVRRVVKRFQKIRDHERRADGG